MNRCHRIFLILLAGFWATGCDSSGGKPARHHSRSDSAAGNSTELRPDIFSSAPGNVEGCVGLYTYDSLNIPFDSLDVDKGKKILATKTESFAFLKMHGKNVVLRYDSAESVKWGEKGSREVYRGSDLKVILVTRALQEEGEAVEESGTLEIIHGDKHFTIKVKGLSGC